MRTSRARNHGISEARGEVIVFTDDDVTIPDGWLAALLAPFADPECAGVGGAVTPIWESDVPPWASQAEPYRMMGGIVQYSVKPIYTSRAGGPALAAAASKGKPASHKAAIKDVILAEAAVPTKLKITAKKLKLVGQNQFKPIKTIFDSTVDNPIERTASSYKVLP